MLHISCHSVLAELLILPLFAVILWVLRPCLILRTSLPPLLTCCFMSPTSIYYMLSTPFENEVYLGFSSEQLIEVPSFEMTFLGGAPVFLRTPQKSLLLCSNCINQGLTFMCQVFCPLELERSYNRVLYIFFCEKCQHEFRCIKQQASKKQEIQCPKVDVKTVKESSLEIDSQALPLKELQRIRNKAKRQVEQEVIEEAEDEEFDEEGEDVQIKEIEINVEKLGDFKEEFLKQEMNEEKMSGLKVVSEAMQQTKKQEKDPIFQEYRRVMNQLDGPILLYSNIPIPYNNRPINPRHTCKYCKSKLQLELQITQKILLTSPKLVNLDWGSLMVFTCSNSCPESNEECVVVQFQTDAVQDSEINALKKRQKNRKRKEKSAQNKEKGEVEEKKEHSLSPQKKEQKEEEGDWD